MSRKLYFTLFVLMATLLLAACSSETPTPKAEPNMPNPASVFCEENGGRLEVRTDAEGGQAGVCVFPDGSECDEWAYFRGECKLGDSLPVPNMPNPASVFCEENGGRLEIRTDAEGGQAGVCIFPDGSECDEWAYFRGECKPGASMVTPEATPTAEIASDGWKVYNNEKLGYSLHYPPDARIEVYEQGQDYYISIIGPPTGNEDWPVIYVGHPPREEFRMPEGADLEQWLSDHNLLVEERMSDVTIAGTIAIHTRKSESGQSYPDDRFTFAHAGQIYQVTILHTGNKQDWDLYNHFLESIQFDQ